MKNFIYTDRYVPTFEGEISSCRHLQDYLVIFDRNGNIIGERSSEPRLRQLPNFYDAISTDDVRLINDLCISFDYKWLLIDTDFGRAVIFTSLCGACGLLFAVIPLVSKEAIYEHLTSAGYKHLYVSDLITNGRKPSESELISACDTFRRADDALSNSGISAAKYRLGASMGKYLSEHILSIADFVGCIGSCRTSLDFVPQVESFSAEIFISMTFCIVTFARGFGLSRSFEAKIEEYQNNFIVSFRVDVDENFLLYRNYQHEHSLLRYCDELAASRGTYFECYVEETAPRRLIISYMPTADPMVNRRIKQSVKEQIRKLWSENQ